MVILGEWISGAVCMYIVDYLLENYGNDERVRIKVFGSGECANCHC